MTTWTKETIDLNVSSASLTVDSVKINGTNIGHTDDTDLLSLASGTLTVNGAVTGITTLATSGDVTVGGNLTITGNILTFGNTEVFTNAVNNILSAATSSFVVSGLLRGSTTGLTIKGDNDRDTQVIFAEFMGVKWSVGNDATDDALKFDVGTTTVGSATKFQVATNGDCTVAGDLTVNGGDITVNNMTASGYIKAVATEGNTAAVELWADEGDDAADKWQIEASADGKLNMMTYASGGWATNLSVNSHATATSSSVTVAGDLYVGGDKISLTTTESYGVSSYSVNRTITGATSAADTTDVLATLIKDLIDIGIIDAA